MVVFLQDCWPEVEQLEARKTRGEGATSTPAIVCAKWRNHDDAAMMEIEKGSIVETEGTVQEP